jgi:hypothetical protein
MENLRRSRRSRTKHCADAAAAMRGGRDELLAMMTMSLD